MKYFVTFLNEKSRDTQVVIKLHFLQVNIYINWLRLRYCHLE